MLLMVTGPCGGTVQLGWPQHRHGLVHVGVNFSLCFDADDIANVLVVLRIEDPLSTNSARHSSPLSRVRLQIICN